MNKGNCIDKFIEKKVNSELDNIIELKKRILSRIGERSKVIDYFDSACYEKDFSDIRKIKESSNRLIESCNKFLERISEQYSKLN